MAVSDGASRNLQWDGCFNVRDLGGLPTATGGLTRRGRLIRADALDGLTAAGWTAAVACGVRTVIDLRNDDERGPDAAVRPDAIATLQLPLDVADDREFWDVWATGPQFGTPLYFRPHLDRFPERSAAVLVAIARAAPGAVVFHCGGGRDRAGQITMLVLAACGVTDEAIAADYALSAERLSARYAAHGQQDQGPLLAAYLAERGTTPAGALRSALAGLEPERRLRGAGVDDGVVAALRTRLLARSAPLT